MRLSHGAGRVDPIPFGSLYAAEAGSSHLFHQEVRLIASRASGDGPILAAG